MTCYLRSLDARLSTPKSWVTKMIAVPVLLLQVRFMSSKTWA